MIPSVNCPRGMCWEAGRCSVWGYPGLHSKFQTSESCILWPCLRNTENEMVSCTVPWRIEHYIATRNVLREKRQSWQLSGLRWKRLSDGTVGSWEWWERPDRCSLLLLEHCSYPSTQTIPAWSGFSLLHYSCSNVGHGHWLLRVAVVLFLKTRFAGQVLYGYMEVWEAEPHWGQSAWGSLLVLKLSL